VIPWQGLSAEELTSAAEHHARVLGCVDRLPEKERQVLVLSAFEELPSVEIAEVLGITESSVRSRLFRARNLLAEMLDHARSIRPKPSAEGGALKDERESRGPKRM
jgi:RNA polymerase sigma-70 factor (ECF subfamily)